MRVLLYLALATLLLVSVPGVARWWTDREYKDRIYTVESVPPMRVAVVFGAWHLARPADPYPGRPCGDGR